MGQVVWELCGPWLCQWILSCLRLSVELEATGLGGLPGAHLEGRLVKALLWYCKGSGKPCVTSDPGAALA